MKICVIILNYNLPLDTISLVSDLKKQVLPKDWELEIVVVDNASTDDSINKIKSTHPDITLLPQKTNLGVAGGYNAGIKSALEKNNDYIITANNDLIIEQKNCLENLINALERDKNSGVAAPLILFAKGFEYEKNHQKSDLGKIIWYAGGIINWNNILMSHRGVNKIDTNQYQSTGETDFATGAFMVFPAKILKTVGLFNENYYLYLEDVELCQRIKLAGHKILFVPIAKIAHKVSQTPTNQIGGSTNDYYITRNRLLFGLKYAKFRTKFALLREAIKLLFTGRPAQKQAIKDFFSNRLGKKV